MQRRTLRDSARRPRAGRVLVVLLPLTSGRRERFQALCADAGAWIIIRAPQRACGLSWFRQSSGDGFVYFPWKRRIRKVDAREWAAREQFGMPVALAELFDVVCQSGVVATAQGGFIPMDRRTATMLSPGDMSLNGLIDSVQKLGCSASAGTAEAESPSAVVAD